MLCWPDLRRWSLGHDASSDDLILMDMQMPKMNGRQAAKWLREHGWDGPIIAVSIHASDKDHEEFLEYDYEVNRS